MALFGDSFPGVFDQGIWRCRFPGGCFRYQGGRFEWRLGFRGDGIRRVFKAH